MQVSTLPDGRCCKNMCAFTLALHGTVHFVGVIAALLHACKRNFGERGLGSPKQVGSGGIASSEALIDEEVSCQKVGNRHTSWLV